VKRAVVVLVVLLAAVAGPAAHAAAFTQTDHVATMDDGVGIAATLYVPEGTGPFPAIMMFHGLGGNRQSLDTLADAYAGAGYVVLASDFRGHGQSGGLFSGLGRRERQDLENLRDIWLPANARIDGAVGAWGISLGGGAALHPELAPRFRAITVYETWTDLYGALVPQNLPKTGAVFQFLGAVPRDRQAPELLEVGAAVTARDRTALTRFADARSSASSLVSPGYPPTYVFQGRRDFAFGLEQGLTMFQRLRTTRLYVGPFGHAPSRFPAEDIQAVLQRSVEWYDRWLKGSPNGIETRPRVEVAADPFNATIRSFDAIPPTATSTFALRGRATIGSAGKVVRRTARLPRLVETFGSPTLRVRASSTTGWSHLVAVLVARTPAGDEIVVSEGGAPTALGPRLRDVRIRLISQVTRIPAGSRLELTLAGTSTAQNPGNLLYLVPVAQRARITLANAQLQLPVLRTPVSR
jgi:predicted acyl esterase